MLHRRSWLQLIFLVALGCAVIFQIDAEGIMDLNEMRNEANGTMTTTEVPSQQGCPDGEFPLFSDSNCISRSTYTGLLLSSLILAALSLLIIIIGGVVFLVRKLTGGQSDYDDEESKHSEQNEDDDDDDDDDEPPPRQQPPPKPTNANRNRPQPKVAIEEDEISSF